MIEKLKSFSSTKYSLDELLVLSAFQRSVRVEYESTGIDVPDWLEQSGRAISAAIKERVRDELERKLASAKARRASLKTADERRKEADEEIAALTAKLG